ncbi:early nodulin-like protein 15 isoform X2 [Primulina tabacum]|uniref:early nodulin-like protein 15 isoform X2 n=1 Tax=Primulina tabacum TaxID=48773 RepID=UPI003F59B1A7
MLGELLPRKLILSIAGRRNRVSSSGILWSSAVFEYDVSKDSVLLVTKGDYLACNTSSPIKSYRGGNTTVKLERSGPFYFICGEQEYCVNGQKIIVVVISERDSRFMGGSPASSSENSEGIAPTSGGGMLKGGLVMGFFAALVRSFVM